MHINANRLPIVILIAAACGAMIAWPNAAAFAQPAANDPPPEYLGAARCDGCHKAPTQLYIDQGATDFVSLTESKNWFDHDKHAKAYKLVVESDLGRRMCTTLGIDLNEPEKSPDNAKQAQQCLSCHSGWTQDVKPPPTFKAGVTCESCHGASSKWDLPHSRVDWRKKSPAEKGALGMIEVRDPVRRAQQCFSCHIGNVEEGKVVTHEMYAAGHPPLPSIEIESFARQMPLHWRYLSEKPDFQFRKEFIEQNFKHLAGLNDSDPYNLKTVLYRTQAVVISGVVAMRESAELFAAQSGQAKGWPEFAAFDCYACHHDLKVPSWRQERGYPGKPGRPTMPYWPSALVKLGILQVSKDRAEYDARAKDMSDKLAELHSAISARPFGDTGKIQTASANLIALLDTLASELSASRFDQKAAKKSVLFLLQSSDNKHLDRDSARQIAWAIDVIYADLNPKPSAEAEIKKVLDELRGQLRLELPAGPISNISNELPDSLRNIAEFKSGDFALKLQRLRELLAKQ